jgi:hypothetical protein
MREPIIAYVDIWGGSPTIRGGMRRTAGFPAYRLRAYDSVRRSLGIMSNTSYASCWAAMRRLSRCRVQRSCLPATTSLAVRSSVRVGD